VVLLRTERHFLTQTERPPVKTIHLYLTSLTPLAKKGSPAKLLAVARNHWEIENGLHWVKDACLGEDAGRNKKAALGLAWLRNLAVFLFRFIEGDSVPQKILRLNAKPTLALKLATIKRKPRIRKMEH
jgi:hypothetical protein